jgi:hypothetical protein
MRKIWLFIVLGDNNGPNSNATRPNGTTNENLPLANKITCSS